MHNVNLCSDFCSFIFISYVCIFFFRFCLYFTADPLHCPQPVVVRTTAATIVTIVTTVTVVVAVMTIGDAPVVAILATARVVDDLVGAVHLVGADVEMNAVDLAVPTMPGLDRGLALGRHLARRRRQGYHNHRGGRHGDGGIPHWPQKEREKYFLRRHGAIQPWSS